MAPKKKLKIFIIAGEVSGDVLGAKIMRELPGVTFNGIGGENMKSLVPVSAGMTKFHSLFPMSDLAVMGIFEVLSRAKTLVKRIDETAAAIIKNKPDIVLTIDSPSFAKRVIKKVKKCGGDLPKFYHVVAPQVWAWGESRAEKFAEIFDKLYCFFEFEVPYFSKYGLKTIPVGHPIADGLLERINSREQRANIKNIALIPGSRMSEVKKLLPLLKQVAEQMCHRNPNVRYEFFIPVVETTKKYITNDTANWCTKPKLIPAKDRYKLFRKTYIAIAASGTVSVELAIMHIPTIVIYKMNPLTQFLARIFVKTKWISLVNILLKKTVYPELLGGHANPREIMNFIAKLEKDDVRKKMIIELSVADKLWQRNGQSAAKLIAKDIAK